MPHCTGIAGMNGTSIAESCNSGWGNSPQDRLDPEFFQTHDQEVSVSMTASRIALLSAVFSMAFVPALKADNTCSASAVTGAYGFSGDGFEPARKSAGALAGKPVAQSGQAPAHATFVGTVSFAGTGMLSGSFTANGNGHKDVATPFKGAYVINADCTGMLSVLENDGHESHFAVTITDGGKEIRAIQTDDGVDRAFVARKQ